jgi:hypothetical protein
MPSEKEMSTLFAPSWTVIHRGQQNGKKQEEEEERTLQWTVVCTH